MKKAAQEMKGSSSLRMFVQKSVEAQKLRKQSKKLDKLKNRQIAHLIRDNIQKKEEVTKRNGIDVIASGSKTQMRHLSQQPLKLTSSQNAGSTQMSFRANGKNSPDKQPRANSLSQHSGDDRSSQNLDENNDNKSLKIKQFKKVTQVPEQCVNKSLKLLEHLKVIK